MWFKDRAFCRGFCPVALLLNVYGRGGMLAVRPGPGRDTPLSNERAGAAAGVRVCPSLLDPATLHSNQDCLMCGHCVQSCGPDRMRVLLRPPFSAADAREPLASWPVTLFVMVVSGFVTFELCGVWKAAEPVFLWVPVQVGNALQAGAAVGWIQGLWTVMVVPLLLWSALGAVTILLGGAGTLGDAWRRLALPLAVIVAAGHIAKCLEKFTSWAGFLPGALLEPTGVQTVMKMTAKTLPQPAAWLSLPALSAVSMLLLATAVFLAAREARLADPAHGRSRIAPMFLLGGFYFLLVCGWGGWGV